MQVLPRAVRREALIQFAVYLVAYLGLITVAGAAPLLKQGAPLTAVAAFLPDQLLIISLLALPLAMVTAFLSTVGRMREEGELTALQAAGVSNWRVVLALLPVALLVAAYLAVAAHLLLPSLSQRLVEGRRQVIRQALAAQVGRRKPVYQDGQLTLAAQSAEDDRLGGLFAVRIGGDGAMTACYAPTARWVADGGDGDDQPALGLEMREARLMHIDAAGEGGRVVTAAVPAWSVRIPTGRQDFSQQSDSLSTVALYQRMRSAPEGSERERRYLRSLERAWHLRWMLPVAALAYWAFAGGLALSIGRGNRMLAVCAGLVTVVATIFPAYVLAREVGEKLPFDSGWWVWPAPLILAAVGGWMLWRRR